LNTLSIRLRYRPIRVGWCVARGDLEAFRMAARWSYTMWGGRFSPIIPVDNPEQAKHLVDLYRVDVLYPATDSPAVKAFIETQGHLPWMAYHDDLVMDHGQAGKSSTIADLLHPINRLFEEHFKPNANADPLLVLHEWQAGDPLSDFLLATFGDLPPAAETAEDYRSLMQLHLRAERHIITLDQPIPPLPMPRYSLSGFNRLYVDQHYIVRNHRNAPGFYMGDASNFDDLVNYWNLKAADILLLFFDHAHADRLTHFREFWLGQLPQFMRPNEGHHRPAVWHREDAEPGDLALFGEQLTINRIGPALWNGFNLKVPFMDFGDGEALASIDNSVEPPSIAFSIPNSPLKNTPSWHDQDYVVSIDPGIGLFRDERFTLHFPFIPALNEFYGRNAHHDWKGARAEPESLGIITSAGTAHLSVRAIEASRLITEIFKTIGIAAAPSSAGLICNRLIHQMGGLDSCRAFKIGGVRDLIEGYSPDQSFTTSAAKQAIRAADTDHPLDNYQQLYIEERKIGSSLTNDAVLAHLLRKQIFRPGLKLDCPNCSLEFWRSLDEVKTKSECEYCGHVFNIAPQLRDRDWAYRRSGLFGRNDNQEGAIPVVLTLQQLTDVHRLSAQLMTTAMTLTPNGADIAACETDFVLLSQRGRDHRIQVAIGECKTRKPIAEQDVQNLLRVANAFPTDRFDVFLVFSKLAAFSADELAHIRQANEGHRLRAIVLTERELEPWFMYERTEKEFDIRRHAVSFEDMAQITHDVFFEPRRRAAPAAAAVEAPAEPEN